MELDEKGAMILADYKMKILPKSAREQKQEFFGKRGWSLHTILVFTKKDEAVEVQAFDHWSSDTKQDAWFTASSFDAMFETLEAKPEWIKIFSDNGRHYHSSEVLAIVRNWHQWYNIDVRGWFFFEAGEAKSLVDSHHATVSLFFELLYLVIVINFISTDLTHDKKIHKNRTYFKLRGINYNSYSKSCRNFCHKYGTPKRSCDS